MSQMRTLPGTLESFALSWPYTAPMPFSTRGVYLGTEFYNRRRFAVHPWLQQDQDMTFANTWLITAQIKARKSTLKKTTIARALGLQAGKNLDGTVAMMRIRDHSRKAENGESEDAALTRKCGGKTFNLATEPLVNPFAMDIGLDRFDHIETAVIMGQRSSGREYDSYDLAAISVGVDELWAKPKVSSLRYFADALSTVSRADVEANKLKGRQEQRKIYHERFKHNPGLYYEIKQRVFRADDRLDDEVGQIVSRAHLLAADFYRILDKDFGRTFSHMGGMADFLGARFANWYWLGMPAKGQGLLETLQWQWLSVAHLRQLDHLIPHINANDEGHQAMSSPDYASMRARSAAITRRFPTWDIEIAQYTQQITGVGGYGTDHHNNAEILRQTISTRIVGHLEENDDEGIADCRAMGFNDAQMRIVHQLRPSQWAMMVSTLPYPIFFTHKVLPDEWDIIGANSSNDQMVDRVPFAEQTDPRYVRSGLYEATGVTV
ncbi:hypothetical protein HJC99_03240 [Candidatus Saccharibacteria bacterium]|nr:hypothetical protein [Candidatus Saccharibacteria bacterium]